MGTFWVPLGRDVLLRLGALFLCTFFYNMNGGFYFNLMYLIVYTLTFGFFFIKDVLLYFLHTYNENAKERAERNRETRSSLV